MAPSSTRFPWTRETAVPLPKNADITGAAALYAQMDSVSCPRAGFCVAGGFYQSADGSWLLMVATYTHGRWKRARELPFPVGTASSQGAPPPATSVACASRTSCAAAGTYFSGRTGQQTAFTAAMSRIGWSRARTVELPRDAMSSSEAQLSSVACPRVGMCVAVGTYTRASGTTAMAVGESHGRWGRAVRLREPKNARSPGYVAINGISCPSRSRCTAVGTYLTTTGTSVPLVVLATRRRTPAAG